MSTFQSDVVRRRIVRSCSVWRSLGGMCVLLAAGCGGDTTAPPAASPYWRVQLNHHAVTLATVAPYDTIRLVMTPLDVNGAPLPTTVQPVYTTSDTSITIDSTGFVRVRRTGSDAPDITVIATLRLGSGGASVTYADTAVFNVIDFSSAAAVPRLASIHLRPVSGDSARRAVVDTLGQLATQTFDNAVATTTTGDVIPKVVVRYTSSDSLIASFATPTTISPTAPQINGNAPGVVLLTAEATVYGRRMIDSLWYTVGYPLRLICSYGYGEISINVGAGATYQLFNHLSLGQLIVGQGGAVLWGNSFHATAHDSLDIQFDRTTGISGLPAATQFPGFWGPIMIPAGPGGNIPAFPAAPVQTDSYGDVTVKYDSTTSKARVFTQPGTYQWLSLLQGVRGTVTVMANDSIAVLTGLPRTSQRQTRGARILRPS